MVNVGMQCSMVKQITEAEQKGKEEEEDEEEGMMSGVEAMTFFFRAVHRESINKRKGNQELDEFSNQAIKRSKLIKEEICDSNFISYHAEGRRTVRHSKEKSGETKNEYKCKKCNKAFGTHQSLGGHMRAHYEPKDGDGSSLVKGVKKITENVQSSSSSCHGNEEHVNTQLSLGPLPTMTSFDQDVNTELSLGPLPTRTSFDL